MTHRMPAGYDHWLTTPPDDDEDDEPAIDDRDADLFDDELDDDLPPDVHVYKIFPEDDA